MSYAIIYHPKVKSEDIQRLDHANQEIIQKAIQQHLVIDPIKYGIPLRWGLKGYRKRRVGDYRIIYYVVQNEIRIVVIGHRKDVYRKLERRL